MIQPILDRDFVPAVYFNRDFLANATRPFSIAVEREDGLVYRRDTKLGDNKEENCRYAERLIKTILWCAGGWKVMLAGDHDVFEYIRDAYTKTGLRAFDVDFWSTTYERDFEVEERDFADMPENKARCRVGFDAGGSDMKVAAVVNGETIWSEEIVWLPKLAEDISYHHEHIKAAILKAAEHMPSFDAVGVSTAGVLVANRAMVSHLFLKVPKDTQNSACPMRSQMTATLRRSRHLWQWTSTACSALQWALPKQAAISTQRDMSPAGTMSLHSCRWTTIRIRRSMSGRAITAAA